MHASLKAKLYGAGITSPDMLWHAIDHVTGTASSHRITPSMRVNKTLRRAVWAGVAMAVVALMVAAR